MANEGLVEKVTDLVGEVQTSQNLLIEGMRKLSEHNLDENAHGLKDPESAVRKILGEVASEAAVNAMDNEQLGTIVSARVGEAIDQQLPVVLKSELHNPQSLINQSIGSCVQTVIDDKIKNGEISGSGTNKPGTPTDPENPDNPDVPVIDPEKPDDTYFWDKIVDPTDTGTLEEGDLYPAPTITTKQYCLKGNFASLVITPAEDMTVTPAKYELFAQGEADLVEVTVNEQGTGIYNVKLSEDFTGPAKVLLAAVAIDQYGNRSAMAKFVLRVVTEDYVLLPEFMVPEADNDAINNACVIWKMRPFKTLCENTEEIHTNSRYRIVNASGQTLFDSYAISETSQLELYSAETPGVTMTPDTEYYLEAQFKGITLGWSGWARRVVKVSRVATPQITSPAAGSSYIWRNGISATVGEFSLATGGLDILSGIDWKLARDPEGLDIVCDDSGSFSDLTHTFRPTNISPDETLYVFARYIAQASGKSAWSNSIAITAKEAVISRPTITSPAANAKIAANLFGIVVTLGNLSSTFTAEVHKDTDWKLTSDAAGNNIIVQELNSSDKLSHIFTGLNLTAGSTYYLFARFRGETGLVSDWSDGRPVSVLKSMISASKRLIWIHESNEIICVQFDYWGTKKTLQVPIAKHRAVRQWGTTNTDVPGLTNFTNIGWYVGGASIDAKVALPAITDADIQSRAAAYRSDKTGRENCDVWMGYTNNTDKNSIKGVPAVQHARGLNIAGLGAGYFDIPNLYELAVIYAESDNIDALDSSVAANPGLALGKAGTNGRFCFAGAGDNYAFSSTECNSTGVVGVFCNGLVSYPGKNGTSAVVPARAI